MDKEEERKNIALLKEEINNEKTISKDKIEFLSKEIDNRLAMLNLEDAIDVANKLNYNLPIDYCVYYAKQLNLHIKPNLFKINTTEKVINSLLSFDSNSKMFILNYQKIDSQYNGKIVPFALLEFGDYLCFDKNNNNIVYYNHETDTVEPISKNWDNFYKILY